MKEIFSKLIAHIAIKAKSYSSVSSCFVFAYEPDLPEEENEITY